MHTYISLALATLICGLALRFGDLSARRMGLVFWIGWVASLLVYRTHEANTLRLLAVDAAIVVGFIWTSLQGRRIWTVIASAFQLITVMSHVAVVIDRRVMMSTFIMSMAIWSYGILICIAFGTWSSWRARRRARR